MKAVRRILWSGVAAGLIAFVAFSLAPDPLAAFTDNQESAADVVSHAGAPTVTFTPAPDDVPVFHPTHPFAVGVKR